MDLDLEKKSDPDPDPGKKPGSETLVLPFLLGKLRFKLTNVFVSPITVTEGY